MAELEKELQELCRGILAAYGLRSIPIETPPSATPATQQVNRHGAGLPEDPEEEQDEKD